MTFTIQDYQDLVRLLETHPEWRAELRRLVLSDDVLTLPESIRELVRIQARTEERVDSLAQAQERTEQRLDSLAQAQEQTEQRLAQLTEQVNDLEKKLALLVEQVRLLVESQQQMETRLGHMMGDLLELRYREHAAGYFGRQLKKARAVPLQEIEDSLEASLTTDSLLDVLRLDLLITGRRRDQPDQPALWLAVEVAAVLNADDVTRASRRAGLMRQAGFPTLPVVAGEKITLAAEDDARTHKVVVVQNGRSFLWDEALAAWPQPS